MFLEWRLGANLDHMNAVAWKINATRVLNATTWDFTTSCLPNVVECDCEKGSDTLPVGCRGVGDQAHLPVEYRREGDSHRPRPNSACRHDGWRHNFAALRVALLQHHPACEAVANLANLVVEVARNAADAARTSNMMRWIPELIVPLQRISRAADATPRNCAPVAPDAALWWSNGHASKTRGTIKRNQTEHTLVQACRASRQ